MSSSTPRAFASSASSAMRCSSRPVATTVYPAAAASSAIVRPIPDVVPVTRRTLLVMEASR